MDQEAKDSKPSRSPSKPDLFLQWGSRKRLRCVKTHDDGSPSSSPSDGLRRAIPRATRPLFGADIATFRSPWRPSTLNRRKSDSPMYKRSESAVAGGGSSSAVYSETVTGWHVLKVEGYSKFKGIGVGQRVKPRTFNVGGHSWCITFFPDGFSDDIADWICVELELAEFPITDIKTSFTLSLLDRVGEPVDPYSRSTEFTFTKTGMKTSCQFRQFISKEDLESSFLKDDSFQIRCDITVAHVIRTSDITIAHVIPRMVIPMVSPSAPPPTELQRHLGDLLASEVGGDVTFELNGELFTAHRYMLAARSPVFMAELFGPMKEKETEHVRILEMEPRVFKIMLHFIYTDMLPEIEADQRTVIAQHLLVAADRYNLQGLKLICEEMLCRSVDISTVATTLVLAEQHACQGLKAACMEFLKRPGNLKAVMASDGFQHLNRSCPSFLQEMLAMFAP